MKAALVRALSLAALFAVAGCTTNSYGISELERQYYQGCASEPPTDPACGHH